MSHRSQPLRFQDMQLIYFMDQFDKALGELEDAKTRLDFLMDRFPYGEVSMDLEITRREVDYRTRELQAADRELIQCKRRVGL